MKKSSMLIILLISSICLLVDSVAGWILFDLGSLVSVVLSIIFLVNARKIFGAEVEPARTSCLWNIIANGALFLLGNTVGLLLGLLTLGISVIFTHGFESLVNIGIGIWQIVVWSKLKNETQEPAVSA